MSRSILIVDDDEGLADMVTFHLKQHGYQVTTVADGRSAVETLRHSVPDLLILDVMLPEMNGFEVCRQVRRETTTATLPIIMLTAKRFENDKVTGLDIGADDYLVKPFSSRELLARVHALLRRATPDTTVRKRAPETAGKVLTAGPVSIDLVSMQVTCRGQRVDLQPKEFALLTYLVRNRGTVLTRDQLLENVWGYDYEGGIRTVDVHIRWLREKLEEDPANPVLIQTVLRVGYCFR